MPSVREEDSVHLPGAVVDSTWYDYVRPLVDALPGRKVEVRCQVPLTLAQERYRSRRRMAGHLDRERTDAELWADPVAALGVGPLVGVDTSGDVDLDALAARIPRLR